MKKIIIMLLILALACNFAGCSTNKINTDTEKQTLSIDVVSENEPSELKTETGLHTTTDNPLNKLETELESMKEEPAESHKQDESVTGTITSSEGAEVTTQTTNHAVETEPMETDPAHVHSFTSKVVPPTCTEKGYTEYTCSCGYSYKDNWTEPLGHQMVETSREYCGNDAVGIYYNITYTCERCGYTETKKVMTKLWADMDENLIRQSIINYCIAQYGFVLDESCNASNSAFPYPVRITGLSEEEIAAKGYESVDSAIKLFAYQTGQTFEEQAEVMRGWHFNIGLEKESGFVGTWIVYFFYNP